MTNDKTDPHADETEEQRLERHRRQNRAMLDDLRKRSADSAISATEAAAAIISSVNSSSCDTSSSASSSCD